DVERALNEWLGFTIADRLLDEPLGESLEEPPEKPKIVSLAPFALADLWMDIQRVADAFDIEDRGRALIHSLQSRMHAIATAAKPLEQLSVGCIEWIAPLMASGNWMPELVEMAGGRNLFGEAGRHAPWLEWQTVLSADPDYLLILPCGF